MENINTNKGNINTNYNYEIIKRIGFEKYGELFLVSITPNEFGENNLYVLEKIEVKSKQGKNEILTKIEKVKRIESKYIVKVYDYFFKKESEKEFAFIIMDYCEKGNLNTIIYDTNYLNKRNIWRIFIQLTQGLKTLHLNYIILKSLSPKNILMDKNNNIKICVFDIIFEFNDLYLLQETEDYTSYICPEILVGLQFNSKCDSWSLGCILYELLFKKRAFEYEKQQHNYILQNIFSIPDTCERSFKIILSKLLCKEKNRLLINEIMSDGIIKKKIIEVNIFDEIIRGRINGKYLILVNLIYRFHILFFFKS